MPTPLQAIPLRVHGALDHFLGQRWRAAQLAVLHDGANLVVRLTLDKDRLVVRVPRADDAALQIDRKSEVAALRVAARAGIAPDVVASETRSGLLITRWIDGNVLTAEEAVSDAALDGIARVLRTLHGLSGSIAIRVVDLAALMEGYLERLVAIGDPMAGPCRELMPAALHWLSVDTERRVLCHCDPHNRNILRNGALRLLDWEYAGFCHPLFDLAAYASYHALDARGCDRLLTAYSAGQEKESAESLDRWRWLFDFVWLLWLRNSTGTAAATGPAVDSGSLLSRLRSADTTRRG